jgi:hypothetical protein
MDKINEIYNQLINTNSYSTKLGLFKELRAELANLTNDDKLQINDSNEYLTLLNNCETEYDNFRIIVKQEVNVVNKVSRPLSIIIASGLIGSLLVVLLRRKWWL